MEVDIRNIPVYWITIEQATDRHERMKTIFDEFGFFEFGVLLVHLGHFV